MTNVVWNRIVATQGQTFHQMRGGVFTYEVADGHVYPDRTNQRIPKSHFEEALQHVPLTDTVPLQRLRGPSYIYAVLMDQRIRQTDY